MGAEAVMALMEATEDTIPCVVSLDGNQVWLKHSLQLVMLSMKNI